MRNVDRPVLIFSFVFLGLCFLSGSLKDTGLFADPALYAGLSQKILNGTSPWALSGEFFFVPNFSDHPPYFFIWGAGLMKFFGAHEISARLMGILPALIGVFVLVRGLFNRSKDLGLAVGTGLFLLTWGHFTRYVFSPYLEASLVVGSVLLLLGALDRNLLKISLGLLIFALVKGVLVLVPTAGLVLYYFRDKKRALFTLLAGLGVLFMSLGMWHLASGPESLSLQTYIKKQVLRSFFEGRSLEEGFSPHQKSNPLQGLLFYCEVILRYSLPWFLLWILGLRASFKGSNLFNKQMARLSLFMTSVFVGAFSISAIHLPHYLHPVYIFWAPVGVAGLKFVLSKLPQALSRRLHGFWNNPKSLALFAGIFFLVFLAVQIKGDPSHSGPSRGGDFIRLAQILNEKGLPKDGCEGLEIEGNVNDRYRAESYALWYLRGSKAGAHLPLFFVDEGTPLNSGKMRFQLNGEQLQLGPCY